MNSSLVYTHGKIWWNTSLMFNNDSQKNKAGQMLIKRQKYQTKEGAVNILLQRWSEVTAPFAQSHRCGEKASDRKLEQQESSRSTVRKGQWESEGTHQLRGSRKDRNPVVRTHTMGWLKRNNVLMLQPTQWKTHHNQAGTNIQSRAPACTKPDESSAAWI